MISPTSKAHLGSDRSSPATLFDKIWSQHVVTAGEGAALILIDRILLHERTGGIALKAVIERGLSVAAPCQVFATMDHVVDTRPGRTDHTLMPTGADFIRATRDAANYAGVTLFDLGDPRQGIVHVISPEQGIVLPGLTLVCPDSHTCTQGALGALAWGIGSTEAEHALATSTLRVKRPKTLRIEIGGVLAEGVTAKDLALHLLARFGVSAARGCVVEYAGSAVRALNVEGRMTLCNLAAELGAFTALIAPDEKVFAYLSGRPFSPSGAKWDEARLAWAALKSDDGAVFDEELRIDADDVAPMVSWGVNPQQAVAVSGRVPAWHERSDFDTRGAFDRALDYMGLAQGEAMEALAIDVAFIGSCTNSRLSDLRRAAAILKGRTVAPGVTAICVPGSTAVKAAAEAEGLDDVFRKAGFEWRESGCSMCFFVGGESFPQGCRVISSTNRNFEGRQGIGVRTHIASPETAAASALAGHIADARTYGALP